MAITSSFRKFVRFGVMALLPLAMLTACKSDNDDDPEDYTEWANRNAAYVNECKAQRGADGAKLYETVTPAFAPGTYTLLRWHNDRTETQGNLVPMDNSTVKVNYQLHNIDGTLIDKGVNSRFQPNGTVVGFWTALTNMHVGDSVTAVVPYDAGYGNITHGTIKPYSTLIFSIRLKEIIGYEIKH